MQSIFHDGGISIHTRNFKYGKLVTGELVCVQSTLVRRMRSHFLTFPWGVEVILGMNGYIWVGKPKKAVAELDLDAIYSSELSETSREERGQIIRTSFAIKCLDKLFRNIDDASIAETYNRIKDIALKDLGQFDVSSLMQ